MIKPELTQEELKKKFIYNPTTGLFTKLSDPQGKVGTIWQRNDRISAYHKIGIKNYQFLAHRLAWLYMNGEWPKNEIDHIDGNGLNNRWSNLRHATRAQNSTNSPAQKSNKIGLRGVHFHKGAKKWRAQICKNLKITHLGYFDTPEQASVAYQKAARVFHGEFVRQ